MPSVWAGRMDVSRSGSSVDTLRYRVAIEGVEGMGRRHTATMDQWIEN